jgi:hypothetical protein
MRKDGGDGVVVSQPPLVEEAVARRVRVLGSLKDMAVRALAMDVGVGLGLAVGVDRKKAKACGGEEPKDVRWEERGLGDPFVGNGSSTRKAAQPRSSEKNAASRAGQTPCTRWAVGICYTRAKSVNNG